MVIVCPKAGTSQTKVDHQDGEVGGCQEGQKEEEMIHVFMTPMIHNLIVNLCG